MRKQLLKNFRYYLRKLLSHYSFWMTLLVSWSFFFLFPYVTYLSLGMTELTYKDHLQLFMKFPSTILLFFPSNVKDLFFGIQTNTSWYEVFQILWKTATSIMLGSFSSFSLNMLCKRAANSLVTKPQKDGEDRIFLTFTPSAKRRTIVISKILAFYCSFLLGNFLGYLLPQFIYYHWIGNFSWSVGLAFLFLIGFFFASVIFLLFHSFTLLLESISPVLGSLFGYFLSFLPIIWQLVKFLTKKYLPKNLENLIYLANNFWIALGLALVFGTISLFLYVRGFEQKNLD